MKEDPDKEEQGQRIESQMLNRKRRTSTLEFAGGKQGEFYVRGAVCWPVRVQDHSEGFILLGAQNVRDKKLYVFEQTPYRAIDHIMGHDRDGCTVIQWKGISSWLNEMWKSYFCSHFYYDQGDAVHRLYKNQVTRSEMIKPKPTFRKVWTKDDAGDSVMWGWLDAERLVIGEGSAVQHALQEYKVRPPGSVIPAVQALMCLLAGIERYPWRWESADYG